MQEAKVELGWTPTEAKGTMSHQNLRNEGRTETGGETKAPQLGEQRICQKGSQKSGDRFRVG